MSSGVSETLREALDGISRLWGIPPGVKGWHPGESGVQYQNSELGPLAKVSGPFCPESVSSVHATLFDDAVSTPVTPGLARGKPRTGPMGPVLSPQALSDGKISAAAAARAISGDDACSARSKLALAKRLPSAIALVAEVRTRLV